MAIGTIDIIYTVRLLNGDTVELTSGQLAAYRFVIKVLWVLFYPVRWVIKIVKAGRGIH
jgi:hypothetical protein